MMTRHETSSLYKKSATTYAVRKRSPLSHLLYPPKGYFDLFFLPMIYCGRKRTQGTIIVNAWLHDRGE
jgi:hypothetical protein